MYPQEVMQNTVVNIPRLKELEKMVKECSKLPGDIAEIGVYKGGTGYLLASAVKNKFIYLFDTFTGLPEVDPTKDKHRTGDFKGVNFDEIVNRFKIFPHVEIHKGLFPDVTGFVLNNKKFCFVHIDVDIYTSVKSCLEFFYPNMVSGGIMVLDDYNASSCPGAKEAADNFCKEKGLIVQPTVECQAIIKV